MKKAAGGGALAAVPDEYAWGNTTITQAFNIINGGTECEFSSVPGNAVYGSHSNVQGPMKVNMFAEPGTTRSQAGATYYGIMEMSGNLWERTVTVGNPTGRGFTGVVGDGALSASGNANETAWPGLVTGEVTAATGAGFRGGAWSSNAIYLRASDRYLAAGTGTTRYIDYGGRGCRVAA